MPTTEPCGNAPDPREDRAAAGISGRGMPSDPHAGPSRANPHPTRRRPVAAGCMKALAMLAQNPISHAPIPRLHVSPVKAAGSLIVHDRASGDRFAVYTPRFRAQLLGGHRPGRWYARPVNSTGTRPTSRGFPTAKDAIDALKQGRWRSDEAAPKAEAGPTLRIFWSAHPTPTR